MFKVIIALDESLESLAALQWASTFWPKDAYFQLVTVVLPMVVPTVPLGVEADMVNMSEWTLLPDAEERAVKIAEDATTFACSELKLPRANVTSHVLRPIGGASGVGSSIVEFVRIQKPNVLVMGSRSLNGMQRTFMGLIGAGSVSDYVLHHVNVPVLAVHWSGKGSNGETAGGNAGADADAVQAVAEGDVELAPVDVKLAAVASRPRQVVVSLDDSETSLIALHWVFKHVLQDGDMLHLLCVSLPPPMPVLDEVTAMVTDVDVEAHKRSHWAAAQAVLARAAAISEGRGIPQTSIVQHCRLPQGGASGVGESITQYVELVRADLVVLGSRGMGTMKAALMNLIGLGSVSEYVMHKATCPTLIIKHDSLSDIPPVAPTPPAEAPQVAA